MKQRVRLRQPRWLVVVVAACLLFLWVQNPLIQFICSLMVALTMTAWMWTKFGHPGIAQYEALPAQVIAGEPVQLNLKLRPASSLPLPWLQLTDKSAIWPKPPRYLVSRSARRELICGERHVPTRRGIYPLGPVAVTWGDPFGLFEASATLTPPSATLVVFPRVVRLTGLQMPLRQPQGQRRPRREAFEDVTSPADQRPFLPGDSVRRINWKTSARLGELYTREYDYTATTDLHIYFDLATVAYDRQTSGVRDDEPAAQLAAAVAEFGLRHGWGVSLTTHAPDRRHLPLRQGRYQLQPFLELLAAARPEGDTPAAAALQLEQHLYGPLSTLAVISPDTSPELATVLAGLRQRRLRILVLTVCADGVRPNVQWEQRLQAFGISCYSVSGPEHLNERSARLWQPSARS